MTITQTGNGYRYPDALLGRILAGCHTGEEWFGWHPDMPIQVSNLGRVRGPRGKVLKPHLHKGYLALDTCGYRHIRVHRLVLECFVGPRGDDEECCHWDGVKTNCRLDNLRWDDRYAQRADSRRHARERQRIVRERLALMATG